MNPIQKLIDYENMTQKEFSEKIHVKQQYINKLIKGKVGIGAATLKKIAIKYPNINLKWLLEFPDQDMFLGKENINPDTYNMDDVIRYLYENNDRLLENSSFKEFLSRNMEILNIEKEQEILEERKVRIKAELREKLAFP